MSVGWTHSSVLHGFMSRRWSEWSGALGFCGIEAWRLVSIHGFAAVQRRRQDCMTARAQYTGGRVATVC